ncbi:uncharacterized protein [Typha latifolia]|uniref:uncharacterized protein n=1 Tax=Typha latifolia TaxID=4733 RepID=UPI003C2C2CF8
MAEDDDGGEVAAAAWIVADLRFADVGWTAPPAWLPPSVDPDPELETEEEGVAAAMVPAWPHVPRGKRSMRRRTAAAGKRIREVKREAAKEKERWMRASPSSPLDYSGGSGASTSGGSGGEEGSSSPAKVPPIFAFGGGGGGRSGPTTASKLGHGERQLSVLRIQAPRPNNPRPGKKMRLPELQDVVRSLMGEREMLRKDVKEWRRALEVLSADNKKLELRLKKRVTLDAPVSLATEENKQSEASPLPTLPSSRQSHGNDFEIPDLNFPAPNDLH